MTDYEYYYNNARSRYYNASSEINSCENNIYSLKTQHQQKINLINQLKTEIKNTQSALEGITQTLAGEEGLKQKISTVSAKTSLAATNFSAMVSSSDVKNKDLTEVYGEEMSATKASLDNIFNELQTKKVNLTNKLSDLQAKLKQADADLQNINNQIRTTESNLQSWKNTQRSAANDMEYYRRKMQEAAV